MIYANRLISPGAAKTLTGNNPWPTSAKSRVQHGRSKGRAVLAVWVTTDWFPVFIAFEFDQRVPDCNRDRDPD
jgi:hypothetical protein